MLLLTADSEKLIDLLQEPNCGNLRVREEKGEGRVFVEGQTEFEVQNAVECFALLKRGEKHPDYSGKPGHVFFTIAVEVEGGRRSRLQVAILQKDQSFLRLASALAKQAAYIPYRETKLTRLLSNSLGSQGSCYLFCCIDA